MRNSNCTDTVLYAFLLRGNLPLLPVWESYWRSCPRGSVAIAVHSQNAAEFAARHTTKFATRHPTKFPVSFVPEPEVVRSPMRWSFAMINATLALYRVRQRLPCAPRWIQILSESCAPVASCARVHEELARSTATRADRGTPRHSGVYSIAAEERSKYGLPAVYGEMIKTSQWITIQAAAADALVAREAEIAARWTQTPGFNGGHADMLRWDTSMGQQRLAPDEWIWWQEIRASGFQLQPRGLTWTSINDDENPTSPGGHALTVSTAAAAAETCTAATSQGRFFARKFNASAEVIGALLSHLGRAGGDN